MKNYTLSQLEQLYQKAPSELKEVYTSAQIGENIKIICEKHGVTSDDFISDVIKYSGRVIIGALAPSEFRTALETEVKLDPQLAKNISEEIDRIIFYPYSEFLRPLYPEENLNSETDSLNTAERTNNPKNPAPPKIARKKTGQDKYREAIG